MPNDDTTKTFDRPDGQIEARSIIDKLEADAREKKKQIEDIIEDKEEWEGAVNRIFSSPDGKLLGKYLIMGAKIFSVDTPKDNVSMIEDIGKRKIYLKLIRQYLKPAIRSELENQ